jgi:hypothetical protein
MENIGTERVVISCEYREIEKLIDKYYGEKCGFKERFEIPCLEQKGNDEDWEVDVDKREIYESDKKYLKPDDKGRYRQWSTRTFLNDLCNRDIIKPGSYLISISW